MRVKYTKTQWINQETPLNEDNLNKIEGGIEANANAINEHQDSIDELEAHIGEIRLDIEEIVEEKDALEESINASLSTKADKTELEEKFKTLEDSNLLHSGFINEINIQIENIKKVLTSDDVDFDTLQELVNALKNNVSNIGDIFTELTKKANKSEVYSKNEMNSIIGDINSILDTLNGEV